MNKKHIGSSFDDHVKELEKKYPTLRAAVDKLMAKTIMGNLLKKARKAKGFSQAALAKKAKIPQSVIARIESPNYRTMPRLSLFSDIVSALGYRLVLSLENNRPQLKKAA
jgi:ribosome-binding protein aMBF1 (putative translation factor)